MVLFATSNSPISLLESIQTPLGAPLSFYLNGYRGRRVLFPTGGGVKRLQHGAEHSPIFSAEDTNEWSCTIPNPTRLHGGHKDNHVSPFVHDALLVVISDRKIVFRQ
jgi:hypothetical protein